MRRFPLLALAALLCAASASAQSDQHAKDPRRPRLEAGADTNDAEAYYAWGIAEKASLSDWYDASWWASRLDPSHVAFVYAQGQALWRKQPSQWREEYLAGAEWAVQSRESRQVDSLYYEALQRDPFVHLYSKTCYIQEWVDDVSDLLAASALEDGFCFKQAAMKYAFALKKNPKLMGARLRRARALYFTNDFGGAATELHTLIDQLREQDTKAVRAVYETKTMYEYMLGEAWLARGDVDSAKAAFQRAVAEDLSFPWTHRSLARLAMQEHNVPLAITELAQAVELRPDDAELRAEYGFALLSATPSRNAPAEEQLRKAITLDPYFAEAYFNLGVAYEKESKYEESLQAFTDYLARAPRTATRMTALARTHAQMLRDAITPVSHAPAGSASSGTSTPPAP